LLEIVLLALSVVAVVVDGDVQVAGVLAAVVEMVQVGVVDLLECMPLVVDVLLEVEVEVLLLFSMLVVHHMQIFAK
jgi:hypothetical protein